MLPLTAQRQEQEVTGSRQPDREGRRAMWRERESRRHAVRSYLDSPGTSVSHSMELRTEARCTVAVSPPIPVTLIPCHQDSDFVWAIMCLATRLVEISHGQPVPLCQWLA